MCIEPAQGRESRVGDLMIKQVEPICIRAPVVSGLGEAEVLQRLVLDLDALISAASATGLLPLTTVYVADAVLLTKRVEITQCDVFRNKVLVNGLLHKDILLKVAPVTPVSLTGVEVTNTDCDITVAFPLDLIIECPFSACVAVPGACPGDTCEIEKACVDAEKEVLVNTDPDPYPEQLEEKVCIQLVVKTIRDRQVTIVPAEVNICPGTEPKPECPPSACGETELRSASRANRL